jgi:hypothetical protein
VVSELEVVSSARSGDRPESEDLESATSGDLNLTVDNSASHVTDWQWGG